MLVVFLNPASREAFVHVSESTGRLGQPFWPGSSVYTGVHNIFRV